jgi:hypothetical protein
VKKKLPQKWATSEIKKNYPKEKKRSNGWAKKSSNPVTLSASFCRAALHKSIDSFHFGAFVVHGWSGD